MGSDRSGGKASGPPEESAGNSNRFVDSIHEVLSNRRRRNVLRHLFEDEHLQLSTLSERVARSEYDQGSGDLPVEVRQRTYLELYHTHIPKLEEHGFVEHCEEEGTVTLTGRTETLETFLLASTDGSDDASSG